jgi:hypothetical protein
MANNVEIKGEITHEVIQTISDLMAEVLGRGAVDIILKRSSEGGQLPGSALMYAFAQETQQLLGDKGSFATLRQVGRSLAKRLMQTYPEAEWSNVLRYALNDFGFASHIEQEAERAFICHCVFFDQLDAAGLQPTQHAVCWAGWGFIEGFMKALEGVKTIEWVGRDLPQSKCEFHFKF